MRKLTIAIAVLVGGVAFAQVMGGLVGKKGAIEAKSGSKLKGTYDFSLGAFRGVKLVVKVTGAPEGEHGRWGRATQRPTCLGTRS